MAGPRVRMGVHWAREGTMAARQHNLTRHRVYAGPAVQIAGDVGEAANGGQILLTEVRTEWCPRMDEMAGGCSVKLASRI
jgi:class 3 adenylate cyclase